MESLGREGGRWVLGAEWSPAGTRADEEQAGVRHEACAAVRRPGHTAPCSVGETVPFILRARGSR